MDRLPMRRAGERRHKIVIEQQSDAVDYSGQPLLTWTAVQRSNASIDSLNGKEGAITKQMHAEATHLIATDAVLGVELNTAMRVTHWDAHIQRTREYNILEIANLELRYKTLELTCREIVG